MQQFQELVCRSAKRPVAAHDIAVRREFVPDRVAHDAQYAMVGVPLRDRCRIAPTIRDLRIRLMVVSIEPISIKPGGIAAWCTWNSRLITSRMGLCAGCRIHVYSSRSAKATRDCLASGCSLPTTTAKGLGGKARKAKK